MNFLTSWLLSVVATAFLVAIAEALMPDKKVRQVGHLVGGLLMLLVLLQPLMDLRLGDWRFSAASYFAAVEEKENTYRAAQEEAAAQSIKEQCEAYIAAAAQNWGLSVHPSVELAQEDSVPSGVTLDVSYHEELSAYIEQELGIAPNRQIWLTKEETG